MNSEICLRLDIFKFILHNSGRDKTYTFLNIVTMQKLMVLPKLINGTDKCIVKYCSSAEIANNFN